MGKKIKLAFFVFAHIKKENQTTRFQFIFDLKQLVHGAFMWSPAPRGGV